MLPAGARVQCSQWRGAVPPGPVPFGERRGADGGFRGGALARMEPGLRASIRQARTALSAALLRARPRTRGALAAGAGTLDAWRGAPARRLPLAAHLPRLVARGPLLAHG